MPAPSICECPCDFRHCLSKSPKSLLEEHNATKLITCLFTYPASSYWQSESKPQALTASLLRKFSRKKKKRGQEESKGLFLRGREDTGAKLDHSSKGGFQKPRIYSSFKALKSHLSQTYLLTRTDKELITVWLTEIYYLEWHPRSHANFSFP